MRITYGSVIAPKDLYRPTEADAAKIEFGEEFQPPAFEDMKNPENWVHLHPNILDAGRVTHLEPVVEGEQDKDELMNKLLEADPIKDRLKPLNEDNRIAELVLA